MVFIEEVPFTKADTSDHVQLDDYFALARAHGDPPTTTSTTQLVRSRIHSISD
jgi:hypothetical protein